VLMLFVILRFDLVYFFFFSSRRRHTRSKRDWSSDVCSSDLRLVVRSIPRLGRGVSCGWIRCDPAPVFTVDPPAGDTIADAGHSCRFGLPVVRCPDSLPSGHPSSRRVRTARPVVRARPHSAARHPVAPRSRCRREVDSRVFACGQVLTSRACRPDSRGSTRTRNPVGRSAPCTASFRCSDFGSRKSSLESLSQSTKQAVGFRPVPLPFTAAEARQRGITAYALAAHERFGQIFRGIWVDSESLTDVPTPHWADHQWLDTWMRMTGIRMLYPDLAADHLTAARLYGLPLPSHISDKSVHVAAASRNLRINRPGLVVRRPMTLATEWIGLLGMPLVTIPRVIATLAPLLSLNELVTAGDAAIGKHAGGPYITRDRLREEIAALPRVAHRRRVQKALTLMRETVDSPKESW